MAIETNARRCVWLKTLIVDHSSVVQLLLLEFKLLVVVGAFIVVSLDPIGKTLHPRSSTFAVGRSNALNRPVAYKHFGSKFFLW